MVISRYRLRFEKRGALRYISHHDLMRVFELALRRSGLPVAYTQGFNPHPRLSFALALPLGIESLDEIVDLDLQAEGALAPEDVLRVLGGQMPKGLVLTRAEHATGRPRVAAVEYQCVIPQEMCRREQLQVRLDEFLGTKSFPFTRSRGPSKPPRRFDARVFTLQAGLDGDTLRMRFKAGQDGGMKPSDLLLILGLDPERLPVTKTRTLLDGELHNPHPSGEHETQNPNECR